MRRSTLYTVATIVPGAIVFLVWTFLYALGLFPHTQPLPFAVSILLACAVGSFGVAFLSRTPLLAALLVALYIPVSLAILWLIGVSVGCGFGDCL